MGLNISRDDRFFVDTYCGSSPNRSSPNPLDDLGSLLSVDRAGAVERPGKIGGLKNEQRSGTFCELVLDRDLSRNESMWDTIPGTADSYFR